MKRLAMLSIAFAVTAMGRGLATAAGKKAPATITNSLGMKMNLIPAGDFEMGTAMPIFFDPPHVKCNDAKKHCEYWDLVGTVFRNETPRHKVTISKPFYIGRTEVTQAEWQKLMGTNPSTFKNPQNPVEMVTWDDAVAFTKKLNEKEGHTRCRLPTEAEWEYAARAGSTEQRYGNLDEIAWHDGNAAATTHPVGQKKPNAFGLHDMLGNVWEWASDWYQGDYYAASPAVDPQGPAASASNEHACRGGGPAVGSDAKDHPGMGTERSRLADRGRHKDNPSSVLGFRIACAAP